MIRLRGLRGLGGPSIRGTVSDNFLFVQADRVF